MSKNFQLSPNAIKNTFCVFQERLIAEVSGLKIQFQSKSGSTYYYTPEGMYRLSNHWGRLANSKWRLVPLEIPTESKSKLGFALWDDFYSDNSTEKLYYLEADFNKKTVTYQHRNNPKYDKKSILRTSFETTKRIKQVRNLFELTSWAKHFDNQDIDELRFKIITELIFTEKELETIKREVNAQ